jgi:hypothetical protein
MPVHQNRLTICVSNNHQPIVRGLLTGGGVASEGARIPMSPEVRERRLPSDGDIESLKMSAALPILVLLE